MDDLSSLISRKLQTGHTIRAIAQGHLNKKDSKSPCILALIQFKSTDGVLALHCLLLYEILPKKPSDSNLLTTNELLLRQSLPVDSNFILLADPGKDENSKALNILWEDIHLFVELASSEQTTAFITAALLSKEDADKHATSRFHFKCLDAYNYEINQRNMQVSTKGPKETPINLLSFQNSGNKSYLPQDSPQTINNKKKTVESISSTRGMSSSNMNHIREYQISHQMSQRENAYTNLVDISVFVGTWNVNGQPPPEDGLREWLAMDADPPDIYAIAFQELDLSKEVFIFNATPREEEWRKAVINNVHHKASYSLIKCVRLIGMMLIVLVQEKHYVYVRNVYQDTVGTGIMNKLGNKGAVSIRLDFHNTSICFVNAHMAAHTEEVERRNEDHDDIFKRVLFMLNPINGQHKTIKDHEHVYFFGDMNYRINPGNFDTRGLASKGEIECLLKNDQLLNNKSNGRIFNDFNEGQILFKPTFKYDLYTDNWDSSEKARQPAWCDRILWKGKGIDQLHYRSHPKIKSSDHKPVSSTFKAKIKVIDVKKQRKVYEDIMKDLDKMENDALPQVEVKVPANPTSKENEIILDPVKFLQPQIKEIIIKNTGQVPTTFEFINKLNDTSPCKPWLQISPRMKLLPPMEECVVSFEVLVDKRTVHKLNAGTDQLYDILVLHLLGGKDIFITIIGDYVRSCFGSSINALVHMSTPFKDAPISLLIDLESKSPTKLKEMPYAVPKELWYLIDYLHKHGMQEEGLFTTAGLKKEISEVISMLDSCTLCEDFKGSIHSVAEVLLLFLDGLPEAVIPSFIYKKALEVTHNFSLCKEVLEQLPDHHKSVFTYLMAFLKELLSHSQVNGLDASTIAHAFGSILIRTPAKERRDEPFERRKDTFIYHFLVNEYD